MGVETKIQWAHHTWNPWRGCIKVSPGCANCYAERDSRRNPRVLGEWGPGGRRALAADQYWRLPYRWDYQARAAGERRRVFTLSLGDWLELRPDLVEPRARLLTTIQATRNLDWLLLTKRPGGFYGALEEAHRSAWMADERRRPARSMVAHWLCGRPPSNVWVGVSVEDQDRADERYEWTVDIPAYVRFLSCEPLLGPIRSPSLAGIDWVIVGGESGPIGAARPCVLDWIRSIIEQCRADDVAPFVKQLGSEPHDRSFLAPGMKTVVLLHDPKGGDPDEWPSDLRVREFPTAMTRKEAADVR